jgi:hypothetical protein
MLVFMSSSRPETDRRDGAIRDLLVCQPGSFHRNIGQRAIQWVARRHESADRRPRILGPKQGPILIPRDTLPNDLLAGGQPEDNAERAEQRLVARLLDDPATGGDHGVIGILQILQRPIFLVSEVWLPERSKDLGNRFCVFLSDRGVGINKAESPTASDLSSDRRLSGPHKADQNQIADGFREMHNRHSFDATSRNGQ